MYVLCVSQDTPLLESVIEPLEEECVFPLLIHHLSSLRSLRPSCRTSLSHIVLTTSPPGLLFCHRSSPTLPCVAASAPSDAFVTRLSGNPANPLESQLFLFGGHSGGFSQKNTRRCRTSNYFANVLHNTMPLFHRELPVFAKALTHTLTHKHYPLFFGSKTAVRCSPSEPPYIG